MTTASVYASNKIDESKEEIENQAKALYSVAVFGFGVYLISLMFPTFFIYPYLKWEGATNLWRFWPFFLWATLTSVYFSGSACAEMQRKESFLILRYDTLISVLAGIWEEIGFRCIYICYAMILVVVVNWMLSVGIGVLLALVLTVTTVVLLLERSLFLAILTAVGVYFFVWIARETNVVYWFFENILITIIHYTTFFQMDSILYGEYDKIFLFGALLANSWFRDGHRNKGFFGLVNSWYAGVVLLYAMMTYGLLTAVVLHISYNIVCDMTRFAMRDTD